MTHSNLFVSDLDWTLLQKDASLSDFSRSAIISLLASGVNFTVASARNLVSIRQKLGPLPLKLPVIGLNGAMASDYATGTHLMIARLSPPLVPELIGLVTNCGLFPILSIVDDSGDHILFEKSVNQGMDWFLEERIRDKDPRMIIGKSLDLGFPHKAVSMLAIGRKAPVTKLLKQVQKAYPDDVRSTFYENLYHPGWYWLTLHHSSATKSNALRWVIEHSSLQDTHITAFGDSENDMDMLKMAHTPIAVANAEDDIKEAAVQIIGPHYDDSVCRYMLDECGVK